MLIFTPLVILTAWLLTIAVDAPSKDFAYELDMQCRLPAKKYDKSGNEIYNDKDKRESFCRWFICNWKMWALGGYFFVIILVAEIYNAAKGTP